MSRSGAVTENWARATIIARPSLNSSSARDKRPHLYVAAPAGISMNEADTHIPAIHVFELEAQSALLELAQLERKMKRAAMGPFEIIRSVFLRRQK